MPAARNAAPRGRPGPAVAPAGPPAPVTVIVGDEEFLVERAITAILAAAGAAASDPAGAPDPVRAAGAAAAADPAAATGSDAARPDVHDVRAADLAPGELAGLTAPSLFGGGCVVVIRSAQDAGKDIAAELLRYAADPAPGAVLAVTHAGGAKGKTLLTGLLSAGASRIDRPAVRRFGERMDFLRGEFRRHGRKADEGGLRGLLDAVGTDLRELAAAVSQLAADTNGTVTAAVVGQYYRGRAEASGFTVADRAVEGRLADALEQLRWALAVGTSPVLISSALAQGVRALGRVGSAPRGRGSETLAADLGMPPWKIDRVRQQLRGWTPDGVARAHSAVAAADAQVKGEGASAAYALERAVTTIVASRAGG